MNRSLLGAHIFPVTNCLQRCCARWLSSKSSRCTPERSVGPTLYQRLFRPGSDQMILHLPGSEQTFLLTEWITLVFAQVYDDAKRKATSVVSFAEEIRAKIVDLE